MNTYEITYKKKTGASSLVLMVRGYDEQDAIAKLKYIKGNDLELIDVSEITLEQSVNSLHKGMCLQTTIEDLLEIGNKYSEWLNIVTPPLDGILKYNTAIQLTEYGKKRYKDILWVQCVLQGNNHVIILVEKSKGMDNEDCYNLIYSVKYMFRQIQELVCTGVFEKYQIITK